VSASAFQSTPARADLDPQFDPIGPIDVQTRYQRPAAAVYLDLQAGQPFQVQITHEDDAAPTYERYDTRLPLGVLRVYDPDENLVLHRVLDAAVDPVDHPALAPDDLGAGLLADATLQATSSGTYTVRFSAGHEHSKLHVGVPPGTDYALSYGNGIWQDWRASQGPLWLWVPSHPNRDVTVELRHEGGSVTLWGENDAWSHVLDAGAFTRTVSAGTAGELWRVDDLSTDWKLRAGGDVPVLFASSQAYAEELDAGLLTVESGPLAGERVAHQFQKRMAEELVEALIAGAGDAASLRARATAVLTDPACAQVTDGTEAQVSIELLARPPARSTRTRRWTRFVLQYRRAAVLSCTRLITRTPAYRNLRAMSTPALETIVNTSWLTPSSEAGYPPCGRLRSAPRSWPPTGRLSRITASWGRGSIRIPGNWSELGSAMGRLNSFPRIATGPRSEGAFPSTTVLPTSSPTQESTASTTRPSTWRSW